MKTMFRFKTKEEFVIERNWFENKFGLEIIYTPKGWNNRGDMQYLLGTDIPDEYNLALRNGGKYSDFFIRRKTLQYSTWSIHKIDYIIKENYDSNDILKMFDFLNFNGL